MWLAGPHRLLPGLRGAFWPAARGPGPGFAITRASGSGGAYYGGDSPPTVCALSTSMAIWDTPLTPRSAPAARSPADPSGARALGEIRPRSAQPPRPQAGGSVPVPTAVCPGGISEPPLALDSCGRAKESRILREGVRASREADSIAPAREPAAPPLAKSASVLHTTKCSVATHAVDATEPT